MDIKEPQQELLTVHSGDGVGHVDVPIGRLGPHAATRCAGVSVSLSLRIIGNIVLQIWITGRTDCRAQSP